MTVAEIWAERAALTMPDPPTHCSCGRRLVADQKREGYTSHGEPVTVPWWRCPKAMSWWSRLTMTAMFHDEYHPDHFFKPYWHRVQWH